MTNLLLIFEIANNHQGDVKHGLRIIDEIAKIKTSYPHVDMAIKLQYRHLKTFIHKNAPNSKYVQRFLDTELDPKEMHTLVKAIQKAGLISVVTPFDVPSVELCEQHGIEILKIASCSANDWPLLQAVIDTKKSVIASTGGCRFKEIDKLVSFFEHRDNKELILMHCVGIYPTPLDQINLSFMQKMQRRYNQHVGYSGHEDPDEIAITQAAIASGARVLERHFGVPADDIQLNEYSMNPKQGIQWVKAALDAMDMQGIELSDKEVSEKECQTLRSLSRAAFASEEIKKGEQLKERVYFAFPSFDDSQTLVSEYNAEVVASQDYKTDDPIIDKELDPIYKMRSVIHEAKGLLREANIRIGTDYQSIELSHHHGMQKFRDCGAIIINVINREYCKKLIICLPGQRHPLHFHKTKEETFHVLYGAMDLQLEKENNRLCAGDQFLIEREMIHGWHSINGCVFEEISTTHIVGDSYYCEAKISSLDPTQRKTILERW